MRPSWSCAPTSHKRAYDRRRMSHPSHRARKRFGQHFLLDPGVIARIVELVDPRPGQALLEIGPGHGALTYPLLDALGSLQVIELDRDLVAPLQSGGERGGVLTVHQGDALEFDFCAHCPQRQKLRLVGNLPYNISTPLLFHLFAHIECLQDMHFTLQQEVVERMAAAPGSRAYGRLSIMVQLHCRVEPLMSVPPGAFAPPPRVYSAVVRLTPHRPPPVRLVDRALFERLVRDAFNQRRKTVRNGLRTHADEAALRQAGIDPGARAETLTLQSFARLANVLANPENRP